MAKDLPPRTEEEVYANMDGIQMELYKAELKRIQKALLGLDSDEAVKKNSFAILQGLRRLRQICCHPGLIAPKYLKEESSKLTALFYLLDQVSKIKCPSQKKGIIRLGHIRQFQPSPPASELLQEVAANHKREDRLQNLRCI